MSFVDHATDYHSPQIDRSVVADVLDAFHGGPRLAPLLVEGWEATGEDGATHRVAARLFPTRHADVVLLDVAWLPDPDRSLSSRNVLTVAEARETLGTCERILRRVGADPLPAESCPASRGVEASQARIRTATRT